MKRKQKNLWTNFGKMKSNWRLMLGVKPMLLFGYRSYDMEEATYYAFYFACIDICLIVEND
jgi:hypothetical protein